MKKQDKEAIIALPVILGIGGLLAWAGGQHGVSLGAWTVYAWCIALAFVIQWVGFVPAYLKQSEKYYDLIGTVTYLSVILVGFGLSPHKDLRSIILSILIACWTLRLGSFLFLRIRAVGEDSRFRDIKPHFFRFLMAWTLQGLWVCFSVAAALAAITTTNPVAFGIWGIVGTLVWIGGFGFEALADYQKSQFRKDAKKQRPLYSQRALGLLTAPQLLRGNRALDRHCTDRIARLARLAVDYFNFTGFRHPIINPY